ncbi:MAG TPA: protein kinase [Dokdonella sp.]|uniref:serine/threonine-protein kinase n=1 Tax=Dokdonella sp. TaxID=2291710 RepID=UPI002D7F1F47|nr:protein kinase [Dokdonella sp.]HET9033633.1 protein kinase [Dokdonella sp.]
MSNDKKDGQASPGSDKTVDNPSEDQPTRLMPDRANHAGNSPDEGVEAPTRIIERDASATVVVARLAAEEDDANAGATRILKPAQDKSAQPAASEMPQTSVSMPHAPLPAAPLETSVSAPAPRIIQVPAPATGASASPSAARTAGSAADRDELPNTGDFIRDRFELIEELGRGGMGAVFRARDLRKMEALDPDPFVAIKFITGSLIGFEKAFVALQREAKNAQSLNHPNIVKVFDFDRDDGLVYLTMEVVEGVALHARMRASNANPLTPPERAHLTTGMLAGMSYAHSRDLSHADLKPSNMMVDSEGNLKILDFGIARRREYDTVFDADDLFALTIDYASLEMLNRQRPTPSDDVYALGCIIYAMHAGAHPFNHVRADLAFQEKMRPSRPKSLTRVEWQALRKALEFKREQRFADAAQFKRAFEAPDWRKIGSIAAAVLSVVLLIGWVAADPIQSWLTVSRLKPAQAAALQTNLKDGAEYLAGGYAEDAVYAYADVLKLDSHNGAARSGLKTAVAELKERMQPNEYRSYLIAQQQEKTNPAWLKEWASKELAQLPEP